jgi:glutaredoxin 3
MRPVRGLVGSYPSGSFFPHPHLDQVHFREPSEEPRIVTESPQETVTVYRTRSCPFCIMAETLLREQKIPFEEIFLDDHPNRRAFTSEILPGHYTVPLVVVGDLPIGGLDQLRELQSRGELITVLRGNA